MANSLTPVQGRGDRRPVGVGIAARVVDVEVGDAELAQAGDVGGDASPVSAPCTARCGSRRGDRTTAQRRSRPAAAVLGAAGPPPRHDHRAYVRVCDVASSGRAGRPDRWTSTRRAPGSSSRRCPAAGRRRAAPSAGRSRPGSACRTRGRRRSRRAATASRPSRRSGVHRRTRRCTAAPAVAPRTANALTKPAATVHRFRPAEKGPYADAGR